MFGSASLWLRLAGAVAAGAVVAAAAGCSSGGSSSAPPASPASSAASSASSASAPLRGVDFAAASSAPTSAAAVSPRATAAPASSGGAGGGPAGCATRDLQAKAGVAQGAAGSVYQVIVFTNISNATCTLYGYPGVSLAAGTPVTQVGQAASRSTVAGPRS